MMKHLTFLLISIYLCFGFRSGSAAGSEDFDKFFKLIPSPQKIECLPGKPFLFTDLHFIYFDGVTKRPAVDQPVGNLPVAQSPGKEFLL